MSTTWTFGRKLVLGFAIAVAALLAVGVSSYRSTERLIENHRWLAHTHEVRHMLGRLTSEVLEAESGSRVYLLTGDESHLEPYRRAIATIDKTLNDVQTLTADNSLQQRRSIALRPLVEAKLATIHAQIQARGVGFEVAHKLLAGGEGRGQMDRIRGAVGEMDQYEASLLVQRSNEAQASARNTNQVIAWGCLLGAMLVAAAGALISSSLTKQIGAAVQHIRTSSAELQAASNQQASGAREQSSAMSEISTTINELLATSRQIAESARRVAQVATLTAEAARTGEATVGKGHDSIVGIRRQVDVIVQHMLELGRKSQQIGSVLEIVSELAEQTNILAINATIEAAGAGDAGRRFGVVADEIRKLADRVGGSTKEIRGLIDDVRSAVNTTVMTTEAGSKAVEAGAEQFANVALAFTRITSQVSTTTEASREIELSTKQQATAVEQVNVAITNVTQASKEAEVSSNQTLRTASELSHLSLELTRLVQPRVESAPPTQASA